MCICSTIILSIFFFVLQHTPMRFFLPLPHVFRAQVSTLLQCSYLPFGKLTEINTNKIIIIALCDECMQSNTWKKNLLIFVYSILSRKWKCSSIVVRNKPKYLESKKFQGISKEYVKKKRRSKHLLHYLYDIFLRILSIPMKNKNDQRSP